MKKITIVQAIVMMAFFVSCGESKKEEDGIPAPGGRIDLATAAEITSEEAELISGACSNLRSKSRALRTSYSDQSDKLFNFDTQTRNCDGQISNFSHQAYIISSGSSYAFAGFRVQGFKDMIEYDKGDMGEFCSSNLSSRYIKYNNDKELSAIYAEKRNNTTIIRIITGKEVSDNKYDEEYRDEFMIIASGEFQGFVAQRKASNFARCSSGVDSLSSAITKYPR